MVRRPPLAIAGGIALALMASGCGGGTVQPDVTDNVDVPLRIVDSVITGPNGSTDGSPDGNPQYPADVTVLSCSVGTAVGGVPTATVRVSNSASGRALYSIGVDFDTSLGGHLTSGGAQVPLGVGEVKTVTFQAYRNDPDVATCTLTSAERSVDRPS